MKKILVTIIVGASTSLSYGQFFIEAGAGYGLSIGSDAIDYEATESSGVGGSTWNYQQVKGSFGAGLNFGVNLGYMINPNIGIGLNANMLSGKSFSGTDSYSAPGYSATNDWSWKGKTTRLAPTLVLCANGDRFVPYARLGFVFGLGSRVTYHSEVSDSDGDSEVITFELTGGTSYGISSEFGLQFKFSEQLSMLFSLNGVNMSWAPEHFEYTEFRENGIDQLPTMTIYEKEINFVESTSGNTSTPPNEGQPEEMLRIYFPFSSYGLNVGIRFSL